MTQQTYIQDVIGPNLKNYGPLLDKVTQHIFSALTEYFEVDPYAQTLGGMNIHDEKLIINLSSLSIELTITTRTIINENFIPERLIIISFFNKDESEEVTILHLKASHLGRLAFPNKELSFNKDSIEFDYNVSYLPAMIISRTLQDLMSLKIISI